LSFVRQQYFYARHFTRYLCALLSNLPDEGDRLELAHNLFEEMGFGGLGDKPHAAIYREMMGQLGVQPGSGAPSEATQSLIEAMLLYCQDSNPAVGLGALCLGAEAIVPHVYSQIVQGFRALGEREENLLFFRLHIEEDDKHAVTMRKILDRLAADPVTRSRTREAAKKVIEARAGFFEAITERASRERNRDVAVQFA
jgi:pyrroloquinoline quinone (PQQ) biosynthesis protein C